MSVTANTATSRSSRNTRPYRMKERAESTAATRQAIIEAALALGDFKVPLAEVAARAGVTPRTILRHFGDRNGLFVAVLESARERIAEQRFAVEAGDVDAAAANLVDHYEEYGDTAISHLAQEGTDERIDEILSGGREMHRRWVGEKLLPLVDAAPSTALGRRRLAQLVAVCDVYTWKLLRRDSGLSRKQTEESIAELIRGVIGGRRR